MSNCNEVAQMHACMPGCMVGGVLVITTTECKKNWHRNKNWKNFPGNKKEKFIILLSFASSYFTQLYWRVSIY